MKKCFLMFVFLVLSLFLAALIENSNKELADKIASSEVSIESQRSVEIQPDTVFKDN
ncbi:hypothetical protein [Maribacter sp. 2308TA10-17]|uniref:hypothetical protein n=1 Tax=Maribacter sp. 2308TA10-17 TaxID=3386276 RepID=UPI0039BC2AC1